jgi:hypothetical protein
MVGSSDGLRVCITAATVAVSTVTPTLLSTSFVKELEDTASSTEVAKSSAVVYDDADRDVTTSNEAVQV